MAGDIEEPFGINFQGDSVFSGSISFGRYEKESLSWERRSSFSHNRYLEEVEKFSKPGSVNEKKAYFEAHFKKKGGLRQISPESHNRLVYQTTENSASEEVDPAADLEIINNDYQNSDFDDSSAGPENGDHEVTEFEIPDSRDSFTDQMSGPSLSCSIDGPKDVNVEVEDGEGQKNELPIGDELENEPKQNINSIALNEDKLSSAAMESSRKTDLGKRTGKSSLGGQQTGFQKMASRRETKASKSQFNTRQTRKNIYGEAFKSPEKISIKSKKDPPMMCTEEHSSKTGSLSTHAVRRNPKIELFQDSKPIKGKTIRESRSGGKGRTSGESHSSSKKLESRDSRLYPKATSYNRTVNSAMQDTGKSVLVSSFRSIEAAERRKQLHLKSDDKLHINEAERFQSQARTKGKAGAETKKLQKNVDIKSKPIPSAYRTSRTESDGQKAVFKSTKIRHTSVKSAAGVLSLGKDTNSSASEAPDTSKKMSCQIATPSTSETGNTGKKDPNTPKTRVSENCRTSKGQGVECRQRVGAQRSMNLMRRKEIKGVAASGIGHLAVGVTSCS